MLVFFIITTLRYSYAQNIIDDLAQLPVIELPKLFSNTQYRDWKKFELPGNLVTMTGFSDYKARAKLNLDENFPVLMIQKYYNNGIDRIIKLVALNIEGEYCDQLSVEFTADGEGAEFSIKSDNEVRVAKYGPSEAVIKTYTFEDGKFILQDGVEYADVDDLGDY